MPSDQALSQAQTKQKLVQVGNYKLMSLRLGEGATSKVELARHCLLQTKVAMKVISLRDIDDSYILRNLEREAKIMSRLNHPNVARLLEVQSHRDYYFLMMELYPGGDLLDLLTVHDSLEEDMARDIYVQIIRGLEYIHSRGVIHRDLKLENVMMDKTRTKVVISDFGLSTELKEGRILKTRCGTEEYAAPELLDKHTQYDKEVDIWSSGIVLYAMLVGERPFKATGSSRKFLQEISQGLQETQQVALMAAGCSESARRLLSQVLTSVQLRLRVEDILSDDWLSSAVTGRQVAGLDVQQALQVAKSVQTQLKLSNWSPAQILSYVKSPKGRLGKTAGCYNILAKQMEETIQRSETAPTSVRKVLGDLDTVIVEPPPHVDNDLANVEMSQEKKKSREWKRKAKRLERL